MKKPLFLLLTCLLLMSCNSEKEKVCLLKGNVFDRESTALMMIKPRDIGDDNNYIEIPIREDETFEDTLPVDYIAKYIVVFEGEFESRRSPDPILVLTDREAIVFRH